MSAGINLRAGHATRRYLIMLALVLSLTLAIRAGAAAEETEQNPCFDTEVTGRLVAQVPIPMPDPDDDGSIVMHWPWFVDIAVRDVHRGKVPKGKLTTLALMHTYWRSDLGNRRWKLRRNSRGGFNLLGTSSDRTIKRCAADVPAMRPYIGADQARLDQLRREGEERYGRHED